jgi:SmpA / OmlA family
MRLSKPFVATALAALIATLAACDANRIEKLEEGVATEGDVRKQFGEPMTVTIQADGTRIMEYPRQPEGQTNYFITIGADGKMSKLRQVLTANNFAKVQAGMSKDEVRSMLGRPAKTQTFDLKKDEEHWDWRWRDGQLAKVFTVSFDTGGRVLRSASVDDPRELYTGGGGK